MRRFLTILFFTSFQLFSQDYWQQEVNYSIDVTLDDENHYLRGFETFEYINNSPDKLAEIYIHVWPNAYANGETELAKQLYNSNEKELKYGPSSNKGNIDSLNFKVNGQNTEWNYTEAIDIVKLSLVQPLNPGEKILVSTPFKVKIPSGTISRLGHIDQSYQITQWYPKPAVYDKEGWHFMSYLNQGEFYSEYGSFDVRITLPENYVVGATGDLQTTSELEFLNDLSEKTKEAIKNGINHLDLNRTSSETFKTIQYKQENVHDFAWFADKTYSVLKSEVTLPHSNRTVTSWAMFTPNNSHLWSNASEYLNDAIYYYSLWNGDYPYNQVTAVDGTISAGGGMEYPNVTVIGTSSTAIELEIVIVHEVGHNWFYGQLGSNERDHGWMDEGMNTLNELRYIETKYPENTMLSDMVLNGKFHLNDLSHYDMADLSYRVISSVGEDQPIETHSAKFTSTNYGIIMYQKTGIVFFYLKDYLGDELFDKCMHEYYKNWEFKHPQPEDMRASFELTSGKNLNWLFDDLINTTNHIDYKISKVKRLKNGYEIITKNVGQVDGPIEINAFKGDSLIETFWVEPGAKKNTSVLYQGLIDKIVIDSDQKTPEINRQNNSWNSRKLLKKMEPISFEFLIGDNEKEATNIFWTPTISGNSYDKLMIGTAVHNFGFPFNKFNYLVAPSYSFGRKFISGISELMYTTLPKRNLKLSRFGVSIKSFKHDSTYRYNESYYISLTPYWYAKIGNRNQNGNTSQTIRIQSLYRKDKFGPSHSELTGAYVAYQFNYKKTDLGVEIQLRNDYLTDPNSSDEIARITASTTFRLKYLRNKMDRWIELRAFIGQQYIRSISQGNTYRYGMSLSGTDGRQDLFTDNYFFGRNQQTGLWSQQRIEDMGGFKSSAKNFGNTSIALASGNMYIQLPIKPSIFGLFADVGTFHNGKSLESAFNTGIGIRLGNIFGVYFPIWMTENMNNSFSTLNYAERIRFTLRFNPFTNPLDLSKML